MFKNQLQELAQRSSCNLPSYSCLREGPDHAPRFKATVIFNGKIFESPVYCSTLRQAEHAAAEVALNELSRRGPVQSLAARVLDETGVCKNLLQEIAQRAGVNLPNYNTIRSGPGHLPTFTCTVDIAGWYFTGEAAKTKKQAEKNAAMAAWTMLKKVANKGNSSTFSEQELTSTDEQEQNFIAKALLSSSNKLGNSTRHSSQILTRFPLSEDRNCNSIPNCSPTWANNERITRKQITPSYSHQPSSPHLQQPRISPSISQQNDPHQLSSRTGLSIKPGMAYQPRSLRGLSQVPNTPSKVQSAISQVHSELSQVNNNIRVTQSSINSHLMARIHQHQVSQRTMNDVLAEHDADEERWLMGDKYKPSTPSIPQDVGLSVDSMESISDKLWPSQYWRCSPNDGMMPGSSIGHQYSVENVTSQNMLGHNMIQHMGGGGVGLMPPVHVRTMIPVHAAPIRRDDDEDEDEDEKEDFGVDNTTLQMLNHLGL